MKSLIAFIPVILLLPLTIASASTISGTNGFGYPTVSGTTTTITFDAQPDAIFSSLNLAGVTFSGIGGSLRTDNGYPDQYNGRGSRYLDNNAGLTNSIRFDFDNLVDAFAFNWGASNVQWVLTAYGISDDLIESFNLPITTSSNAGDYVGLANPGMAYATLTATQGGDYVFIDNFTVRSVPEPSITLSSAIAMLGLLVRRRRCAPCFFPPASHSQSAKQSI
jgi:hypothetical protein